MKRLALAMVLAACGPKRPPGPASTAPVVVQMKRDACLGACPVYTVTIYADGVVQFDGKYYVAAKGRHTHTVTQKAIDDLRAQFARYRFASWGNFNEIDCYDMPGATITFEGHTVDHAYGDKDAPEELTWLESDIDFAAEVQEWVGPAQGPVVFICD